MNLVISMRQATTLSANCLKLAIECHDCIKILAVCVRVCVCACVHVCVCACVHVCVRYGNGTFGAWDCTGDTQPFYLLYFILHMHNDKQT